MRITTCTIALFDLLCRNKVGPVLSFFALLACMLPAHAQLPPGWSQSRIGSTGTLGTATETGGVINISATGAGTGINVDHGHFVYKQVTGDQEIVFRVTNQAGKPNLPVGAQVGPMIRQDLTYNGRKGTGVFRPNTPNNGFWIYANNAEPISFRNSGGSYSTQLPLPLWFKLVRMGNDFAVYRSLDGIEWNTLFNGSGGTFAGTGSYYMGIWLSSATWTDPVHVSVDNIYVGPPRLKYQTSFVGASRYNTSTGWMNNFIHALYVDPAGYSHTNSSYDETGFKSWRIDPNGNAVKPLTQGGDVAEGSVTGDGTHIYLANGANKIFKANPAGSHYYDSQAFTIPGDLAAISGMACKNGELYVSDPTNNRILVFDTTTRTEITGRRFNFTQGRPGPIAVDAAGNLWIVQLSGPFPRVQRFTYPNAAGVYCYSPAGVDTGRAVPTGITSPISVCVDASNRLLVADNGPDQNIKIVTGLDTAPAITGTFGETGGIYAGANPGRLHDAAAGGDRRFYGLTGVGTDSSGNIYVSCSGAGADLRKFSPAGAMLWRKTGTQFLDCADFDPASDGTSIYTREERIDLSYPTVVPPGGVTWADKAVTQHRFQGEPEDRLMGNAVIRYINGQKFLITGRQGRAYMARFYRFEGEIAIPCARFCSQATNLREIWTDANGDGIEQPTEIELGTGTALVFTYDVDANGDLWIAEQKLRRFRFQGLNAIGAPQYSFGHADNLTIEHSALLPDSQLFGVRYFSATDTLYGYFIKTGYSDFVVRRFDNFAAGNRTPAYSITLPKPATDPNMGMSSMFHYMGLDVATDKIFICELQGRVHVYDAADGTPVIRLVPGPEIGGMAGWQDMAMGLRAFKRSNGEYVVLMENSGVRASMIMYRFFDPRPQAPEKIGWWKMDDATGTTATDSSGAGRHGTVVNGTWDPNGKIDGCLALNNSTSKVTLPDDLIKDRTKLTVTTWVKTTSTGGVILGCQDDAHPNTPGQFVPLLYVGTDGKLYGQFHQGNIAPLVSANVINDGAWHHVALTGDGDTQTLYMDGVACGTLSGEIDHLSMDENQLGTGYAGTGTWPNLGNNWRFMGGRLDDVRLYNRSLIPGEVASIALG